MLLAFAVRNSSSTDSSPGWQFASIQCNEIVDLETPERRAIYGAILRRAVWDDIRTMRETRGMTILITTHDMEEADGLCDRIALMHHGRIEIIDTPAELKRQVGPEATLDDVFAHYTGLDLEADGGYRQARQARRSARQHG